MLDLGHDFLLLPIMCMCFVSHHFCGIYESSIFFAKQYVHQLNELQAYLLTKLHYVCEAADKQEIWEFYI